MSALTLLFLPITLFFESHIDEGFILGVFAVFPVFLLMNNLLIILSEASF